MREIVVSYTLQVEANLAGIGISVTTPEAEVLYVLLDGIRARATSSKVSRTGEACIRTIQASPSAAHSFLKSPVLAMYIMRCHSRRY